MGTTRPAGGTAGAPAVPGSAAGAWVTGAVDTAEIGAAEPADGREGPEQPATSTTSTGENNSAARDLIFAFCLWSRLPTDMMHRAHDSHDPSHQKRRDQNPP
jgi:hypothetical protein